MTGGPLPEAGAGAGIELWSAIRRQRLALDEHLPADVSPEGVRLLKIGEEYGEAVSAYFGSAGLNSRKGRYATEEDLAAEVCDVIITAMVTLDTLVDDEPTAREVFDRHLLRVLSRNLNGPGN